MVVLPKDDPLFVNLNAYYLDIGRLIEHLQGEVGTGGLFFQSYKAEGALFFDQDRIINAIFRNRSEFISGKAAIGLLTTADDQHNFNVSVYRLGPEDVYFWASLPNAEKIYKELSTEFTDLDGLIKKMGSERLTGYIDVQFDGGREQAMIFLINGREVGTASSWNARETGVSKQARADIVQRAKSGAAVFNVCRISTTESKNEDGQPETDAGASEDLIRALEEFLAIFEQTVGQKRHPRLDFDKLLKHKFVANAEKYAFLDPFAAEFEYGNQKITFRGRATGRELSRGVIFSAMELADELGLRQPFSSQLTDWARRHSRKLIELDIMV